MWELKKKSNTVVKVIPHFIDNNMKRKLRQY